eukprot:GHVU01207575.1.p2 GENE.GHVU01207575.1~~GHVU01207575.1.p2  ORF type:complete len:113 (+),score=2.82 GHVU01207575.1:387-725(+)
MAPLGPVPGLVLQRLVVGSPGVGPCRGSNPCVPLRLVFGLVARILIVDPPGVDQPPMALLLVAATHDLANAVVRMWSLFVHFVEALPCGFGRGGRFFPTTSGGLSFGEDGAC